MPRPVTHPSMTLAALYVQNKLVRRPLPPGVEAARGTAWQYALPEAVSARARAALNPRTEQP